MLFQNSRDENIPFFKSYESYEVLNIHLTNHPRTRDADPINANVPLALIAPLIAKLIS
jgi:hypothetical protein